MMLQGFWQNRHYMNCKSVSICNLHLPGEIVGRGRDQLHQAAPHLQLQGRSWAESGYQFHGRITQTLTDSHCRCSAFPEKCDVDSIYFIFNIVLEHEDILNCNAQMQYKIDRNFCSSSPTTLKSNFTPKYQSFGFTKSWECQLLMVMIIDFSIIAQSSINMFLSKKKMNFDA